MFARHRGARTVMALALGATVLVAWGMAAGERNKEDSKMDQERQGEVTFAGNPLTLVGPKLKVGDAAPDAVLVGLDLSDVSLSSFKGKTVLISAVPSLDTGVCDVQSRRFNEEAGKLEGTVVITVSMDLPFAQKRWCGAAEAKNMVVVSDHKTAGFGTAYGVLIKELRLLTRAVFVVAPDGTLTHVQIVPEVTDHLDYEAALAAARP